MTEITLHLSDEDARRLSEEAQQKNLTPEIMATRLLAAALAFEHVAASPTEQATGPVMSEEQFQESLDRTMQDNLELLKRLA